MRLWFCTEIIERSFRRRFFQEQRFAIHKTGREAEEPERTGGRLQVGNQKSVLQFQSSENRSRRVKIDYQKRYYRLLQREACLQRNNLIS